MHAPTRAFALSIPAPRILIALSLLIVCGISRAHPVQFGSHTLDIPAPNGMFEVKSGKPGDEALRAALSKSMGLVFLVFAPQSDVVQGDTVIGKGQWKGRMAGLYSMKQLSEGSIPDSVFDPSSPMGKKFAQVTARDMQENEQDNPNITAKVESLGVFRHESWGLFFSSKLHEHNYHTGKDNMAITSTAILKLDHSIINMHVITPVNDDTNSDQMWAETTLSKWADSIHRANQVHGTHAGMLYKAVPWIVLVVLLLLGYLLFFKKSEQR